MEKKQGKFTPKTVSSNSTPAKAGKVEVKKSQPLEVIQKPKEQPKEQPKEKSKSIVEKLGFIKKDTSRPLTKEVNQSKQITSKYDSESPKKKRKLEPITIVLFLLLFWLVLILGSVFLFKDELVTFFNNLLG